MKSPALTPVGLFMPLHLVVVGVGQEFVPRGLMARWPKVQQQNAGGVFCTLESIVLSRAEALAQCML